MKFYVRLYCSSVQIISSETVNHFTLCPKKIIVVFWGGLSPNTQRHIKCSVFTFLHLNSFMSCHQGPPLCTVTFSHSPVQFCVILQCVWSYRPWPPRSHISTPLVEFFNRGCGRECATQNGMLSVRMQGHRHHTCGNFLIMLETIFSTLQNKILISEICF
jgi:hypothetical protein